MDGWLLASDDNNLSLSIYISSLVGSKVVDVVVSWEDIDDDEYDDDDDDDDDSNEYDDRSVDVVVCCW